MKKFGFIDTDSHVIEPDDLFDKYLEAKYRDEAPRARTGYRTDDTGFGFFNDVTVGGYDLPIGSFGFNTTLDDLHEAYDPYVKAGFSAKSYLMAMDRMQCDYMVLYPTSGLYYNQAPTTRADAAAANARAYNTWLHDFCSQGEGRLIGAGLIDLRDPEQAAMEAVRCAKDLEFKAVTINPAPVGAYRIHAPEMDRLWATVADLDIPVAVHPGALSASDPMLFDYLAGATAAQAVSAFAIGNMLACAAFVMGGVLERHPKLRVAYLEAGSGWAAYWLHRQAAGPQGGLRGRLLPGLSMEPMDYWRRQCFISTEPDDPGIRYALDLAGGDNIVIASGFAHPEGRLYRETRQNLEALDVPGEAKRKMMWDNALKLYPIDA